MKKLLVVFLLTALLLLSSCSPNISSSIDLDALSQNEKTAFNITSSLFEGDYDSAISNHSFNEEVEAALSQPVLYGVMTSITAQYGSLVNIDSIVYEKSGVYDKYYVNLLLSKGHISLAYVFDSNSTISGFHIDEYKDPSTSTVAAERVPTEGVTEENIIIGEEFLLSGILTKPAEPTDKVVILVHGSGPSDMDVSVGPNSIFRDIAYDLAELGIASIRYDKRTFVYGGELAGDIELTPYDETIEDVLFAIDYVKSHHIELSEIFVAGHSFGGHLIPEIAAHTDDVSAYIFLAANSSDILTLSQMQIDYLEEQSKTDFEREQYAEMRTLVEAAMAIDENTAKDEFVFFAYPAYFQWLEEYDPLEKVKNISVPMLFLQGERDYQVPPSELDSWLNALDGRTDLQTATLEGLNHLFLSGEGLSTPEEYLTPQNVDKAVAYEMADFIENADTHPAVQGLK